MSHLSFNSCTSLKKVCLSCYSTLALHYSKCLTCHFTPALEYLPSVFLKLQLGKGICLVVHWAKTLGQDFIDFMFLYVNKNIKRIQLWEYNLLKPSQIDSIYRRHHNTEHFINPSRQNNDDKNRIENKRQVKR